MIDLRPAADRVHGVASNIPPAHLGSASPCPELCVGDLLDHLLIFSEVFTRVARERSGAPPHPPSVNNLPDDWLDELRRRLDTLADAWSDPGAWEGTALVGGGEFPGAVAGVVALDELVVHGWDLAVATGQSYEVSDAEIDAVSKFVASFPAPRTGELFGPAVEVADDAPALHRLLGQTGRDPGWRPS